MHITHIWPTAGLIRSKYRLSLFHTLWTTKVWLCLTVNALRIMNSSAKVTYKPSQYLTFNALSIMNSSAKVTYKPISLQTNRKIHQAFQIRSSRQIDNNKLLHGYVDSHYFIPYEPLKMPSRNQHQIFQSDCYLPRVQICFPVKEIRVMFTSSKQLMHDWERVIPFIFSWHQDYTFNALAKFAVPLCAIVPRLAINSSLVIPIPESLMMQTNRKTT
jgi:hypothetical protein